MLELLLGVDREVVGGDWGVGRGEVWVVERDCWVVEGEGEVRVYVGGLWFCV